MYMFFSPASGFQPLGRNLLVRRKWKTCTLFAKKEKAATTEAKQKGVFWKARMDKTVWRPTINDVERISWGKPAKQKGTGSRGVPHRLNGEERFLFQQARVKGFLEVTGSGWRPQRRDAPLLNTYRSLCDARGQAAVVLHKSSTGMDDELVIDISPLRNPEMFETIVEVCLREGRESGQKISSFSFQRNNERLEDGKDSSLWESNPIYHLPPCCIAWKLPRAAAKKLGKRMAKLFDTAEGGGSNKRSSRKTNKNPFVGVKAGKNRRHGGYGIG